MAGSGFKVAMVALRGAQRRERALAVAERRLRDERRALRGAVREARQLRRRVEELREQVLARGRECLFSDVVEGLEWVLKAPGSHRSPWIYRPLTRKPAGGR